MPKNTKLIKPSESVGRPGTRANKKSIPPTINSVLLSPKSWSTTPSAKFFSSSPPPLERVMMMAVAVDVISPGIWLTRPSPMVRIVYVLAASFAAMPC